MIEFNWRYWIFFITFIFTSFLGYNRFINNVKYDFLFRNYIEHLMWGWMLPLLLVIFCIGISAFTKCDKIFWKTGYILAIIIFVIVAIGYYTSKLINNFFNSIDLFKILIDIIGFGLGSWFVMSGRTKTQQN